MLWLKASLHVFFVGLSLVLMSHQVPGWENIKIFDQVRFAVDSIPYSLYLNFDKPLIGLTILLVLRFGKIPLSLPKVLKASGVTLVPCVLLLLVSSLLTGYVRWDPKFPELWWAWFFNNLFLVCLAEEAFFRRYILGGLSQLWSCRACGAIWALLVSSLLFGLVHFKGGTTYVVLSTLAGLFYGWSYLKSGRTESAILTHFGLNSIHFFFFSYPALLP